MHFLLVLIVMIFGALPAWAEVPSYAVVKEKSALKFFAIQNGAPLEGRFEKFTIDIRFDADQLDKSVIKAEVETGSIITKNDDVSKNIRLPEWLSVEAFPKATFVSKALKRTPLTDDYYAEGDMTIRGKTVPVMLNFSLKQVSTTAIATGYITLKRSAFGVGQGQWAKDDVIHDGVRVEFRVVAERQ